jgi:hypothetical protein
MIPRNWLPELLQSWIAGPSPIPLEEGSIDACFRAQTTKPKYATIGRSPGRGQSSRILLSQILAAVAEKIQNSASAYLYEH